MARVNPRQIEAFRALMLTGSTTAAAEMINVTQPAVSRLVRDLQQALGLSLFTRRGTRLIPTSEAHSLYGEVERSFVGLDRIAQAAGELRMRRAGVLRIAGMPALANGFLPRFTGAFLADRPKLDLALYGLVSHLVLDWVASGQCDVGFAEAPVEHVALAIERMPPVRLVAVVPQGHRLARRRTLRPRDFAGEAYVSLGPSTASRYRVDAAFAHAGVARLIRVETPLSEIACALVASGVGVSVCDPFSATEYVPRGVVTRPFEPALEFDFAAIYSAHRTLSVVAREFIDAFAAHVGAFRAAQ